MKRSLKTFMIIIIFLLCVKVNASTTFTNTSKFVNDYIKRFPDYRRFIVTENTSYGFSSGNINNGINGFKNGGLLNIEEYNISKSRGNTSYLFNGLEYFTMTKQNGKIMVIDPKAQNGISEFTENEQSGIRVTNYVQNAVKLEGRGTKVDPWRFINRYYLTFIYDDTKITINPSAVMIPESGTVTVDITPSDTHRYASNNCGGVYNNGKLTVSNITSDATCVVEAGYREYEVTAYANDGIITNANGWNANINFQSATKQILYNSKIETLPTVERAGYTSAGWYTEVEGGTPIDVNTIVKDTTSIYVHWAANEYTLTYDNDGGSGCTSKNGYYDSPWGELCTPYKMGYNFDYWYDSNNTTITSSTIVKGDKSVKAHWTAKEITVNFDAKGGSVSPTSKTVTYNQKYGTLPTPTKTDNVFDGWYKEAAYTNKVDDQTIVTDEVTHTLYAKWLVKIGAVNTSVCLNPYYNGSSQTIVSAAGTGYRWSDGTTKIDAGSQTVTATLQPGYVWSDGSTGTKAVECSILPKEVSVSWGSTTEFTYNGSEQAPTASVTTGVSGETMAVTRTLKTNASSSNYTSTASCSSVTGGRAKCSNYKLINETKTYKINPRVVTIKASDQSKSYDGTTLSADTTCEVTSGSLVSGHVLACTNTGSQTNAGSSTKTLSTVKVMSGSTDVSSNYSITKANGTLTVTKVDSICPTVTAYSGTYDGSSHKVTVSGGSGGTIKYEKSIDGGSTYTDQDTTNPVRVSAGTTYTRVRIVGDSNHNDKTCDTKTVTIAKKAVTIKASDQSKTYDGTALDADTTCEVSSGSVVSGHTLSCTSTGSQTAAGSSAKTLSTAKVMSGSDDLSGNYTITKSNGTLTVNKIDPTLSLSSSSGTLTYGSNATATITTNSDGALSCSTSSSGTATCSISGKTLTITPAAVTSDGGKATITVTLAATTNYNSKSVTYTATVNRKSLTCPSKPSDKTYTGDNQPSGISCPTGSTAGGTTSATNADTYTQTCTAKSGYKFSSTCSVSWIIGKATPTLSLSSSSGTLTYGSNATSTITTNSDGSLSCSSGATSTATCSLSGKTLTIKPAAVTSDGGKATITVSLAASTNYNSKSVTYTATVNRKTLTCPDKPADKEYTGSSQPSGISCPTGSTAGGATSATAANTYTQTCTANAGYKFASTCSVKWSIVDPYICCMTTGHHYNIYNWTKKSECIGTVMSMSQSNCTTGSTATCNAGSYPTGQNQCSTCTAGYYCPGGSYLVDEGIVKCPSGYTSSSGASSQTDCYITCSTGFISTPTSSTCTKCSAGYYASKPKVNYGSTSTCSKCAAGTYSAAGASSCTKCAAGTVNSSEGSTSCSSCPAGTYSTAGSTTCTGCPAGTYSSAGSGSCTKCSAGYYSNGGTSSCTKCSAGTYSSAGASSCTKCSAGTYSAAGASSCTNCAAGKVSSAGASTCSNCPAGTYSSAGSATCTACAGGTYSSAGSGSCTRCAAGTYSPGGRSSCTSCSAGTYSSAGASSCSNCPAGKYSSAGSSSCTCCGAGTYSSSGASSCTACASGKTSAACASSCYTKPTPNCFPGDTKVKTISGYKKISKLTKGELLITYNEKTKRNEPKKIIKVYVFENSNETLYTFTFDNSEKMQITHYHRVYIIRNNIADYIRAENIKINDKVMFADGTYHKVISIQSKAIRQTVYNLKMEDNSNFYVGNSGILVHNGIINDDMKR